MNTRNTSDSDSTSLGDDHFECAAVIAKAGGIEQAIQTSVLPRRMTITLAEAVVLGLLRQGVSSFIGVLGHGSTEVAEVLRIYQQAGLLRMIPVRHEVEASHAATALRWTTGEKAAVVTSIGPGAFQALAASIAPASDGIGVWYLFGDETTHDEGPNMQQIPKHEQHAFLQLCGTMGRSYCLHTPQAVGTALRRGLNTVDHPHRAGPFYLLLPLNTQSVRMVDFNLDELPVGAPPPLGCAADHGAYQQAVDALSEADRVVIKVGGGARSAGREIEQLLELTDGLAVTSPLVSGVIPYDHPRNMTVGGTKGSISGNWAMENADLLIAIGSRFVCQSDCSRTGYPNVRHVININADPETATHYSHTTALVGDAVQTLRKLIAETRKRQPKASDRDSSWMTEGMKKRQEWDQYKAERYATAGLYDEVWKREVLTQPLAIKVATDWARTHDAVAFFDAGDVQANGFQIVEDDRIGRTYTETGASYMGFASSALLATAMSSRPFYGLAITGDGSFTMNPQILIDGVSAGAKGCILLLDNRRMGAISALQEAQYGQDFATSDNVEVDYVQWANAIKGVRAISGGYTASSLKAALDAAIKHDGISLIHVPVYYGPNPLGGLGAFGRWNVGNWCEETQNLRHEIGL